MSLDKLSVKFKEGYYQNVPGNIYHNQWDFASSTLLRKLIKESPAKVVEWSNNEEPPKPSAIFGSLYHKLLLEPDTSHEEYLIQPPCEAIQKNRKRCPYPASICYRGIWYCKKHGTGAPPHSGPTPIKPDEYKKATMMVDRTMQHTRIQEILSSKGTMKELSGQIEMFGLEMKVRFDCINLSPHRTIIDFKTCIDNSPESFKWDSYRYKYWHQAYVYMEASKKLFGNNTISNYFICAIEKEPPFSIAFYKLNPGDIENAGYELTSVKYLKDKNPKRYNSP